jgi:AcrR family transcriptional regulator
MSTPVPKTPPSADATAATASTYFGEGACDANACARDRIFHAATNLFYRNGIRAVSVDAIAAEAGTTKVTFYRVFESKDDLVVKVLEEQSRRFWEWWDGIVAQHPGEPRKQIEALIASFREELCCDEAARGCAVANAAVEIVEEDHPARAIIRNHKLEIAHRLRELCREMGARQPDVLGDALSLLYSGSFAARLVYDGRQQVETVTAATNALLDSALGAPPK